MEPGSAPPSPPTRYQSVSRPRSRLFHSVARPVPVSVLHPLASLSVPSSSSAASLSSTCSSDDGRAEDGSSPWLTRFGWLSGAAIDRPTNPMTRDPRFVQQCQTLGVCAATKSSV
ncbi:hypothetical protein BU14_0206s0001 [Porphyra umbilicalis]|uniref:Uncharacterized protein n=1 Tax=Porphyra umbilicalis TaxID=2786 RepID=A0A1X6P5E9_PORUM|nr:hypothetical protein BU14_0206s0001 [Porphyra umbilicalis]|eukprot:OSX76119.1 hypothetical protein BU14_0206s0001 [Porphyra umbilicalis]